MSPTKPHSAIYAGRIRHKGLVYDGQHEAIIPPERWDRIQASLQKGAAKTRKTASQSKRKTQASLLIGKVYDETGDRLTPTHSKSKTGARLRYYTSNRLIAHSGEKDKDGWRLPAPELEETVAELVRRYLRREGTVLHIVPDCSTGEVRKIKDRLDIIASSKKVSDVLELARRVDLKPGEIIVELNKNALANCICVDTIRINENLSTMVIKASHNRSIH